MNKNYLLRITVSTGLLLIGIFSGIGLDNPGITGFCLAASYLIFQRAERLSNLEGKTTNIKILNSLTPNLIEFTGLALTALFSPQILISVITVGIVGLTESFRSHMDRNISRNGLSFIERRERVFVLSLVFLLTYLNVYWMFYGLILVSGIVVSDLIYSLYQMVER